MTQQITAFADEFGNNSFDFQTQGSHFIIATVITKTENLEKLREEIKDIRKKHNFQTGEIKSSGVGQNHSRRKRIIEDIAKLDISVYAVVVDKRKLSGEGFNYKKSFYKFLNNLLYKELFRTFPNLDLNVDEHGGNDFMRVLNFLESEVGNDQQRIDQINFLKLLLWLHRANPKNRYITTKEIAGHLNQSLPEKIQEEYFRTKVVGNLRDKGVLIASGRQGYKIPTCAGEFLLF
jgi:disulfide oxidoreductase YuzD